MEGYSIIKKYAELFRRCIACGYLPLGLYRKSHLGRYVVTNPRPEMELSEDDAVYLVVPDSGATPVIKYETNEHKTPVP